MSAGIGGANGQYWLDSKRSKDSAVQTTGGQTKMGKDLSDHRGFFDGSDDFQFTPIMRIAFDVDIEHSLEQAGPADVGDGRWASYVIELICRIIDVGRFTSDDFGTVFGVRR